MSWSCPLNSPFMSLTFSRYVRFIFHVCPVLSLRVISLLLPSCRLVSLCFVSLSFPLSLSCPFQFPFVSLSFPVAFLSCRLPISSPHFLALPCISPLLPNMCRTKHGFSSVFAIRTSKNTEFFQIFGKRRQEPQTSKEPAGGIKPGTPVLRHRLPEDYVYWNVIKLPRQRCTHHIVGRGPCYSAAMDPLCAFWVQTQLQLQASLVTRPFSTRVC